jgi:hypothetical protein
MKQRDNDYKDLEKIVRTHRESDCKDLEKIIRIQRANMTS